MDANELAGGLPFELRRGCLAEPTAGCLGGNRANIAAARNDPDNRGHTYNLCHSLIASSVWWVRCANAKAPGHYRFVPPIEGRY